MIVYVDSAVLARAYLSDEDGHVAAEALLADPELALITGTCTRIEVSAALVRAARAGRGEEPGLLALLDDDLGPAWPVAVVEAAQPDVEERALRLVRQHGLRAMDAWHLAVATLIMPVSAEPGESRGFASRDDV